MPIFRDSKRDNPSEMGMLGGGDGMRIGLVRRVGRVCAAEAGGGGIIALRRPRPYSRRLRGYRCGDCRTDHHLRPTDINGKA